MRKKQPSMVSLRDASGELLEACKTEMSDNVYKRCKFIIEENTRVLDAVEALQKNKLKRFGTILYEGHEGLSKLFEIGCDETDFLVDFAKGYRGVLGARQMGGGFGGCTINLVHEEVISDYVLAISKAYKEKFGIDLSPFEGSPSNGTAIIQ